jgi:hypothetical protein
MNSPVTFQFSPEKGLLLDLFEPATPARAVVLYLHGGGFLKGRRSEPAAALLASRLLSQGVAVASADYRLRVPADAFPDGQARAILEAQARSKAVGLTLAARLCGPEMIGALQDADEALAFLQGEFWGFRWPGPRRAWPSGNPTAWSRYPRQWCSLGG